MKPSKNYWKAIEEREESPEFQASLEREFVAPPPHQLEAPVSRRGFLKAAGFSLAGTTLASCSRGPAEEVIPLLERSEQGIPGKAYWYASTCQGCSAGCGTLVKKRDGRPIKIEGNPEHPLSRGGLCAVGQASVLGLYDSQRLGEPMASGQPISWEELDTLLRERLAGLDSKIFLLTPSLTSPSLRESIQRFLAPFSDSGHVEYDAVSYSAILDAHLRTHGRRILPHYRFDQARVIVSFDADFLGTWISPVEFTRDYVEGRKPERGEDGFSHHVQLEGRMSVTGSNADRRIRVAPHQATAWLLALAGALAQRSGVPAPPLTGQLPPPVDQAPVEELADRLWEKRGESLLVCGTNEVGLQTLVNFSNHVLGNYGKTLLVDRPSLQWQGHDRAVMDLIDKMHGGEVEALLVVGANPAYDLPAAADFGRALEKVRLTVSFSEHRSETTALTEFVCPLRHPLESWSDSEPVAGLLSLAQPMLLPFGQCRSLGECLTAWTGESRSELESLKDYWRREVYPRQSAAGSFQEFWNRSVHDGFTQVETAGDPVFEYRFEEPVSLISSEAPRDGELDLVLYEKIAMRGGQHAHNPWLQELPDPVTKAVWDNYLSLAPALARRLEVEEGDRVRVSAGPLTLEAPVQIQPGQHEGVLALAVGYGRSGTDRFVQIGPSWLEGRPTVEEGQKVGVNAYPLAGLEGDQISFLRRVSLAPTGERSQLALTQTHHTITVPEELGGEARHMVRETSLADYLEDPASGNHSDHPDLQLWDDDHTYTGHHWGMAIDLNRCTGCSACVVACQAENNVPVVGKDEVFRHREMHWIRIDRYYAGDDEEVGTVHQPMMCHHCDHAPCETVCPVLATVHSDEGLNQQIYNRCVGTRYCANNCPYKVRRFNWFDYRQGKRREELVLNPDVVTRTRGVMEKCSFCVQRIQEAKYQSQGRGEDLADGDIQTACQQSCPAQAIVFGDMNDPESQVSKLLENPRHYRVLEEMNFRPSVAYLTKIKNSDPSKGSGQV